MDVFVETICVDFEFGADKFNKAIHKSYLKARYFLSNKLDSLVFPFYQCSIVLLLTYKRNLPWTTYWVIIGHRILVYKLSKYSVFIHDITW